MKGIQILFRPFVSGYFTIDSLAAMADGRISHPVGLDLEKWVGEFRN